jgi:phytanoyl-CoA hydroxylase
VAGSHLKGMRPHGRTTTVGFSQSISDFGTPDDLAALAAFPAKPGDLLIHHCMAIHTAGPNTTENRSRKALGLVYFGESAEPDLEAKEAYIKSLNAQKEALA